ncbi:MAG: hypothetical protein QXU45_07815 [Candidatus Bathyarchaeia archaeon]
MSDRVTIERGKCKRYCMRCGREISRDEYEEFGGLCEECYWTEEDELTEEEDII